MLKSILLTADGAGEGFDPMMIVIIAVFAVLIVGMFVFNFFTNKKKRKEQDDSRKFLRPGDKIRTIGGIIGIITEIKRVNEQETEIVFQTGAADNSSTMTIDAGAIGAILVRGPESLAAIEAARLAREQEELVRLQARNAGKSPAVTTTHNASSADVFSENDETVGAAAQSTEEATVADAAISDTDVDTKVSDNETAATTENAMTVEAIANENAQIADKPTTPKRTYNKSGKSGSNNSKSGGTNSKSGSTSGSKSSKTDGQK